jgi:glucose/arabinose dehydrogenase
MIRRVAAAALVLACVDTEAKPAAEQSRAASELRLEELAGRFRSPVYLTSPPGDSRLFVVEQAGRIRVVKNGATLPRPFLDISERVRSGGEQGLLSMAFHPAYRNNG